MRRHDEITFTFRPIDRWPQEPTRNLQTAAAILRDFHESRTKD